MLLIINLLRIVGLEERKFQTILTVIIDSQEETYLSKVDILI